MGLEVVYCIGAFVLLTALIYGTLSYRYRKRALDRVAEDVTRERYRQTKPSRGHFDRMCKGPVACYFASRVSSKSANSAAGPG
jgi:hypothetical protein